MNVIALGFLGSLAAGLMTAVGALPVLIGQTVSQRANDFLLGFAAGVMLSASYFSLVIPGLEIAAEKLDQDVIPALIAAGGIMLGALAIRLLDDKVPHRHFVKGHEGPKADSVRKIWLFVIAITLQNAPEGLAAVLALHSEGYGKSYSFLVAAATGLVEPIAGLAGVIAISATEILLPWGLTIAAGAMIYVISNEIIPETHRHGHHKGATGGLIIGVVVMMFLDVVFG